MEKNVTAFWNYIKNFKGTANLDEIFLKWAASSNLTLNDARKVWNKVNDDVLIAFNKKADISISGPENEIKGLIGQGASLPESGIEAPPIDLPKSEDLENLNKELNVAQEENTTGTGSDMLSTLKDDGEASESIPPTAETASTSPTVPEEVPNLAEEPAPV